MAYLHILQPAGRQLRARWWRDSPASCSLHSRSNNQRSVGDWTSVIRAHEKQSIPEVLPGPLQLHSSQVILHSNQTASVSN